MTKVYMGSFDSSTYEFCIFTETEIFHNYDSVLYELEPRTFKELSYEGIRHMNHLSDNAKRELSEIVNISWLHYIRKMAAGLVPEPITKTYLVIEKA